MKTASAVLAATLLAASASLTWAQSTVQEFEVADLYFELNNTDGDLGIHGSLDGEPWRSIVIRDHRGRLLTSIFAVGQARNQGLTAP